MTIGYHMTQEPSENEVSLPTGIEEIGSAPDLSREAANMLELLSRQSPSVDLLNITSKAAQAVIRQF